MSLHAPLDKLPLFGPEEEAKNEALDTFERETGEWLSRLRDEMRKVYDYRVNTKGYRFAYVTADDARRLMQHRPDFRPPAGVSMNATGALFRTNGWKVVGYTKSVTKGSHGNRIARWAYLGG